MAENNTGYEEIDNSNIVEGFIFYSRRELERAKKEKLSIDKLKETLDYDNDEELLALYRKLVSKKYFATPVGLTFLAKLREELVKKGYTSEVPYIPALSLKQKKSSDSVEVIKGKLKEQKAQNVRLLALKKNMIIAIVALLVCVIGMFFIVATSKNLGYINAEEKVLDKYSAWEEDLSSREKVVREKEKELNIVP